MDSKRKVVLVTGGARGIGRSTIIEFAKKNYDVVINYCHSEADSNELKEFVEKEYNVSALVIKASVSNESEVEAMVERVIEVFGHIDVLVNNAGIAIDTTFDDKTYDNFMETLKVNLIGTFIVSKYVGKYMLANGEGNIINVSSTNGIDTVYPESLDYDASKAGVISLTKNLALQYAPNIRVNTVAPGWVTTDMNKELDYNFIKKEEEKIILNRFADPSEIAKVIVFLASSDASYINGSIIRVDGGCK